MTFVIFTTLNYSHTSNEETGSQETCNAWPRSHRKLRAESHTQEHLTVKMVRQGEAKVLGWLCSCPERHSVEEFGFLLGSHTPNTGTTVC